MASFLSQLLGRPLTGWLMKVTCTQLMMTNISNQQQCSVQIGAHTFGTSYCCGARLPCPIDTATSVGNSCWEIHGGKSNKNHSSPMIFAFPACILAIRRNIGVALLAHLILLLADPIFAFSFWMAVRALHTSQYQYA